MDVKALSVLPIRRRIAGAATSLFAALAILLAVAAGPAPKAAAEPANGYSYFCTNVLLAPFGQSGDTCFAGRDLWGHLIESAIWTQGRAGCVNYAGYYYELYTSWKCVGSNSSVGISPPRDGGSYQGVIRNNNLSYSGRFSGREWCCYFYG
jgi:hypothetical protein